MLKPQLKQQFVSKLVAGKLENMLRCYGLVEFDDRPTTEDS